MVLGWFLGLTFLLFLTVLSFPGACLWLYLKFRVTGLFFWFKELLLLLEETLVEWFELELEELDKRGGGEEPILGGATTPTSLARLFSSEEWTLLGFVLKILSWDSDLMTSLFCSKWVWLGDSKWAWLAGGVGGASKRLQSGGDWTPPSLLLSSSILYFDGNSIGFPVK